MPNIYHANLDLVSTLFYVFYLANMQCGGRPIFQFVDSYNHRQNITGKQIENFRSCKHHFVGRLRQFHSVWRSIDKANHGFDFRRSGKIKCVSARGCFSIDCELTTWTRPLDKETGRSEWFTACQNIAEREYAGRWNIKISRIIWRGSQVRGSQHIDGPIT
jgi:hypothetical protein